VLPSNTVDRFLQTERKARNALERDPSLRNLRRRSVRDRRPPLRRSANLHPASRAAARSAAHDSLPSRALRKSAPLPRKPRSAHRPDLDLPGRNRIQSLGRVAGLPSHLLGVRWRKRVGVEPTRPGRAATPTDLKSARATGPHALPRRIMSGDWAGPRIANRCIRRCLQREFPPTPETGSRGNRSDRSQPGMRS
jgi:hypothetical protein